jgi:hypothetical protein
MSGNCSNAGFLVGLAIDDYKKGIIKGHERTISDIEDYQGCSVVWKINICQYDDYICFFILEKVGPYHVSL